MSKTKLTVDIEEALYFYGIEQGEVIIEEVSMPDDWGRVDTLSCRTKPDGTHEWRCYEVKVSKGDFKSTAKVSFVGNYNYYVLPMEIYEKFADQIPPHIGVMLYMPYEESVASDRLEKGTLAIVKKAKKQKLGVDEGQLLNAFIHSLFREVKKAKRVDKGMHLYSSRELYKELSKRNNQDTTQEASTSSKENLYDKLVDEMEQQLVQDLRDELDALREENQELRDKLRSKRRKTEPYNLEREEKEAMSVIIREIEKADYSQLENFLYNAIYIPDGEERPPKEVIFDDEIYIYIKDFGEQFGDLGVVAETDEGIIGIAWTRIIPAYGNIDDKTPELAISVLDSYRKKGVGAMLMTNLFELLHKEGFKRTSLSVQKDNPAVRFYTRLGYEITGEKLDHEGNEDFIMIKELE